MYIYMGASNGSPQRFIQYVELLLLLLVGPIQKHQQQQDLRPETGLDHTAGLVLVVAFCFLFPGIAGLVHTSTYDRFAPAACTSTAFGRGIVNTKRDNYYSTRDCTSVGIFTA